MRRNEWCVSKARVAGITAVELPEDMVLTRSLVLPPLADEDLRRVVANEVAKFSIQLFSTTDPSIAVTTAA